MGWRFHFPSYNNGNDLCWNKFVFPVLIIAKIIEILNIIKEIGFIEGDNYSISSIATVPSLKLDRSQFTIENLSDRKRKIPHTPYSINKIMIITLLF